MKFGPLINLTREIRKCQKIDDDIMLVNYDVIFILPIYGRFGAIQKLDSGPLFLKFI